MQEQLPSVLLDQVLLINIVWLGSLNSWHVGPAIARLQVRILAVRLSGNDPGQVVQCSRMCLCNQAV